ncbi:MAG: phage major capsid protein [Betaproteobacteria bacterium]|jgi:HK97 family phage major capsid protein
MLPTGGFYFWSLKMELKEVKDLIEKQGQAWEEFKKTNDAAIQAKADGKAIGDLEAKLASLNEALDKVQAKLSRPGVMATKSEDRQSPEAEAYKAAFMNWVRNPSDPERRTALQLRARELRKVETKAGGDEDGFETRAVQTVTSTGSAGGFALPEIIERQIQRLSVDISPIRQIATVRTVGSPDYKELFDINGAAFEWVGEAGTRSQTNTPDLAEVAPTFGMASARPRASEESLDDLFFDVESWLINSAAEAIAQGEGLAFVSGNGTNRPTGFLAGPTPVTTVDASRAFGTLQYIASGQAAALPTSADVFFDLVYALRARYRANATWVLNKLVLSSVRKYKDTTNQYLWQPSLSMSQPETFMGYPIVEAEDMPAVGANAFPVAFGDFREGYLIADRVGMRMTRDDITVPGFVQFYIRRRVGGRIRNSQAIKLLRISTT